MSTLENLPFITLTDSPVIVELKSEFRRLDTREEELKYLQPLTDEQKRELELLRQRKAQISRQIFTK